MSAWEFYEVECRANEEVDKVAPIGTQVFAGAADRQRSVAVGCESGPVARVYGAQQSAKSIFAVVVPQGTVGAIRRYSRGGRSVSETPLPSYAFAFAREATSEFYVLSSSMPGDPDSPRYDIVRTAN